ncbi:YtxH domain-containing protein [Mucilaginibacter sp.]
MSNNQFSRINKQLPGSLKFKKDNSGAKVAVAILAGLAAGAVLGILFAPDKGAETRDKLTDSLGSLTDTIKETASAELDRLADLKERVVSNIKTKISGTEEEYQDDLEHA